MQPNIVFIVMDAVRAENLPFYDYSRNTTPFLCSMEKELTVFENAIYIFSFFYFLFVEIYAFIFYFLKNH